MQELLVEAIRAGRLDEVRALIAQGVDLNAPVLERIDEGSLRSAGVTPLMIASSARKSNAEIVRELLEAGADPLATDGSGQTALFRAARGFTGQEQKLLAQRPDHPWNALGGDVDRMRLLLDAGCDPNETDTNGNTPAAEACAAGDPARLSLLIERGGSVWPVAVPIDSKGTMQVHSFAVPLFRAAESGNADCLRIVLDQGFPADYVDEGCGRNALHYAWSVATAELLWSHGVRLVSDKYSYDPIDRAFYDDCFEVATYLLDQYPESLRSEQLQYRISRCIGGLIENVDAVRLLLEIGADANVGNRDEWPPIISACWPSGDTGCLEVLLNAGADPNTRATEGTTALQMAVAGDGGAPELVRILLERGAMADAADDEGSTPLMQAAKNGELACIQALLAAGADRSLVDAAGKAALDYATEYREIWDGDDDNVHSREAAEVIRLLTDGNDRTG